MIQENQIAFLCLHQKLGLDSFEIDYKEWLYYMR
jgi:hypothetical protein